MRRTPPPPQSVVDMVVSVLVSVLVYAAVLVFTGFSLCGLSGCGGGGFGRSYSPGQTQLGIVLAGVCFLPFTLRALARQSAPVRAGYGIAVALAGSLLAMALLEVRPDGCPFGESRATLGADTSEPGAATCSRDKRLR